MDVNRTANGRRLGAPLRLVVEDPELRRGRAERLAFRIVDDRGATEPYLGAGGHLVALREGDLAFLHVHPADEAGGSEIAFAPTFPTEGRYRLFLQFRHEGRVRTVAFTQEVR